MAFLGRGTIRSRVYDTRFERSFQRGGAAADFLNLQLAWVQHGAATATPVRTGRLRRGWKSSGVLKTGRYHARGQVYNSVSYAHFVNDGTGPRIFPHGAFIIDDGPGLVLHTRTGRPLYRRRSGRPFRSVRGQRGKHMIAAGEVLARQHAAGDARLTRATH